MTQQIFANTNHIVINMTSSILFLRQSVVGKHITQTQIRTMAFKPRRTPPPSLAGVNLKPRPDPLAVIKQSSQKPTPNNPNPTSINKRPLGGAGKDDGWVSPWHYDYYKRLDDSTINHPELLHGDPHMPIQRLSRGDGQVVLNPLNKKVKVKELNDYNIVGSKDLLLDDLDNMTDEDFNIAMGDMDYENEEEDDGLDELEREYGSDAAHAIRQHLNTFKKRLDRGKETNTYSPLEEVDETFRTIDRVTAAKGSTQHLALERRARTEHREFFRKGRIPKLSELSGGDELFDDNNVHDDNEKLLGREGVHNSDGSTVDQEFGHGRGYDAQSVFSKSATVKYPYGKDLPSPTYHPDFPLGSYVGNNPNDPDEEKWMHELNRLIYEEEAKEMELGEIDETYSPVNIQKEDMEKYLRERERTKKYNMLERENEHEKDREEKPDEILEMIKNGEDPNQEAFGPWYVLFSISVYRRFHVYIGVCACMYV